MTDKIKRNVRGSDMTVNVIKTDSRETIEKFGMARGISINGETVIKRMASWKEIKSALDEFTKRPSHTSTHEW